MKEDLRVTKGWRSRASTRLPPPRAGKGRGATTNPRRRRSFSLTTLTKNLRYSENIYYYSLLVGQLAFLNFLCAERHADVATNAIS